MNYYDGLMTGWLVWLTWMALKKRPEPDYMQLAKDAITARFTAFGGIETMRARAAQARQRRLR